MSKQSPETPDQAPEEEPGDPSNENGPAWQSERFEQSYPNAGMSAEERPEIPGSGIEESPADDDPNPEPQPVPQPVPQEEPPVEG